MAERIPDARIPETRVADTVVDLEKGEKRLIDIRSDRATYLRDHTVLAVLGMGLVGMVLAFIGSEHWFIGSLGAVLAIAARGAYLYSEQMGVHWVLTNRRLVGPGGRNVYLMELSAVRRLFGDVQLVTKAGDKYLIKHVAGAEDVVETILRARDRRLKRAGA